MSAALDAINTIADLRAQLDAARGENTKAALGIIRMARAASNTLTRAQKAEERAARWKRLAKTKRNFIKHIRVLHEIECKMWNEDLDKLAAAVAERDEARAKLAAARAPLFGKRRCSYCGLQTSELTAACDHCDMEDK